ncbi:unnamed protein product [Adineta steineri]|uniref:NHL repeat containing protein n=1 Tax=Adineta steineri TaxID=433720 RepID=A0A814SN42_9BILA|nr:unnamed protein product [Adineta steineri]
MLYISFTFIATPILHVWNTTGTTVAGASNGSAGTADNLLLNPYGITLGSFNSLYIADLNNNRIQKWLSNASNATTVAGLSNGTYGRSSVALDSPVSVVLDSNDNMYFTDRNNHRVVYWANGASSGSTIAGIAGVSGSTNNTFNRPCGIARDSSTGTLYIADTFNHRIMQYLLNASSGTVVAGGNGAGSGITQLYYPYGFAFDASSNSLLIANAQTNNIIRWVLGASSWTLVIGSPTGLSGNTSTLLNQPIGITLDPLGNIYVADSGNHRIQFFVAGQSNGTTIAGVTGSGITQLYYPYGFAFDASSNSLLIANAQTNNIIRWVLGASSWTLVIGSPTGLSGSTSTLLNQPIGITLDPLGNIYVADSGNHRIQFFVAGQSNGTTIAGVTGSPGISQNQLNSPYWVIVDNQLNLYVSDHNNNRVQFFSYYQI